MLWLRVGVVPGGLGLLERGDDHVRFARLLSKKTCACACGWFWYCAWDCGIAISYWLRSQAHEP